MSSAIGKPELRRRFTAARTAMTEDAREQARAAVRGHVLAQARAQRWSCVSAYEPLRTEPGSRQLLTGLFSHGVRVLVPVTLADRDLDWTAWSPTGSGEPLGKDGIAAADAVLVPALAVADDGTRLGRGGGSYDRALPRRRAGVPIVALLFDGERVLELPADPWDQPVTAAVSPSGWVELSASR